MSKLKAIAIANSLWTKIMDFESQPHDKSYLAPSSDFVSNSNLKLLCNQVAYKHEFLTLEEMYQIIGMCQGIMICRGLTTYKDEILRNNEAEINLSPNSPIVTQTHNNR